MYAKELGNEINVVDRGFDWFTKPQVNAKTKVLVC